MTEVYCYPCLTRNAHTPVTLHANRYHCRVCGARGVVETISLQDFINRPVMKLSKPLWIDGHPHYLELP